MGIPPVTSYRMPGRTQWAADVAGWRVDPARAALLIHDMQHFFVGFLPPGRSPTIELISNTARIRTAARGAGLPIVYSVQPAQMSRAERGLLHDLWGPGMAGQPGGSDVIDELAPTEDDHVVTKYRYSAFFRTRLAGLLASLGRDQLVVCGVYAHLGCLLTATDAYARDIETFLVADAVADFSSRDHLVALDYAARGCAVTITTDRLIGHLPPLSDASATPAPPGTSGRASGRSGEGGS